jgi:hypothetical protein
MQKFFLTTKDRPSLEGTANAFDNCVLKNTISKIVCDSDGLLETLPTLWIRWVKTIRN